MIQVKKANGELEPFSTEKLERSLRNSGADSVLIAEILKEINSWIFEGVTTKRIYDSAFAYLRRKKQSSSIRYKLKQAIMELGPTGHPFEHFIGKIMENQGYKTEVALIVRGFCVSHEVDVIATKEKHQLIAECKYGQSSDKSVSVQVPLYVHSRVNDIIKIREKIPEFQGYTFQGMVATNTRFTQDSITYSRCSGLKLLGWDYPEGQGLKDLIDRENIYPITVLHTLTKAQLQLLFDKNIVVCSQILNNIESLDFLRLTPVKQNKLLEEIKSICNNNITKL
jgi:hypothetical protein